MHGVGAQNIPSAEAAEAAFCALGHRPEEMIKTLRQVQGNQPAGINPDTALAIVAATLRSVTAEIELAKVEQLGSLAVASFSRIAATDEGTKRIFKIDAAADFSKFVGRQVKIEEIQPVVNEMLVANVIMRRAHGVYCIADPSVQQAGASGKRWASNAERHCA